MTLDEFRARRRDLVATLGTARVEQLLGPGGVEQQYENLIAVEAHAEALAGQIYLARLAHQGAVMEAAAIKRETDWRPERSIFVETAGQAAARADIRETELQRLHGRLAELVAIADETSLWRPSSLVRAALEGTP